MEFSIGEWVERRMDGKVGRVHSTQRFNDEDIFYVDLGGRNKQEDIWAGSAGAWRRHFRVHAHVETSSRDCDGLYTGGHVLEMTLQERCDHFGDLHFQQRVLAGVVTLHGTGTLTVNPEGLSWHEVTDEGYRAEEVRWCEDECPEERSWQRDHTAESMGY